MNRLRDESGLDPISEKGIEMLRAVRPTASSPLLKRRVWAALQESTIATPVRQRSSMLRVLVVGVGLVAFTATAAATIGGRRIAARIQKLLGTRVGVGAGIDAPRARSERVKPVRVIAEAPRAPDLGTLPEVAAPEAAAKVELRAPVAASAPRGAPRASRAVPPAVGDDPRARPGLGGAGCAPARSRCEPRGGAPRPRARVQPARRSPPGGLRAGDRSGRCPRRSPWCRELCARLPAGIPVRAIQTIGATLSGREGRAGTGSRSESLGRRRRKARVIAARSDDGAGSKLRAAGRFCEPICSLSDFVPRCTL